MVCDVCGKEIDRYEDAFGICDNVEDWPEERELLFVICRKCLRKAFPKLFEKE